MEEVKKEEHRGKLKFITYAIILIIVAAFGYAVISDEGLIVSQEEIDENFVLEEIPDLPVIGQVPEIQGIADWINSNPLTFQEDLEGKVVLVDFWTYSCINCIRTIPHLNSWYEKYRDKGFVLLSVHTPEFNFEKNKANVEENVEKYDIQYPVALDNDYATWKAFENRFWPAHYLVDASGNIRFTHFGEGRYKETETAIQALLLEANLLGIEDLAQAKEAPLGVEFQKIGTPEIYFGYLRIEYIGNDIAEIVGDRPYTFEFPEERLFNQFYLQGIWVISGEYAEFVGDAGNIELQYKANKVNVVFETADAKEILVEVKIDGEYLNQDNAGEDIFFEDAKSFMKVREPRLYNLVDTKDEYEVHVVEIIPTSPGLRAFAFTFG